MFTPHIFVFESNNSQKILSMFEEQKFSPFYDAKHTRDYNWFLNNIKSEHRLYSFGGEGVYDYQVEDLNLDMTFWPEFMIVFNEGEVLNSLDWSAIYLWIRFHLFSKSCDELLFKRAEDILGKPVIQKNGLEPIHGELVDEYEFKGILQSIKPEFKKLESSYGFREYLILERDTMLYEVVRPNTLLPFTVVVEKFSTKGPVYLFTDIYGSNEWDINRSDCRFDFIFLQNLWVFLKMDGEFSMSVVKKRVDACYPDRMSKGEVPEIEPIVYRRSIENVLQSLLKKDLGFNMNVPPFELIKRRQ